MFIRGESAEISESGQGLVELADAQATREMIEAPGLADSGHHRGSVGLTLL